MWDTKFLQIIHITGSGAMIVQDKDQMKHISLNDVLQFELDSKFQNFRPHNHYKVEFL